MELGLKGRNFVGIESCMLQSQYRAATLTVVRLKVVEKHQAQMSLSLLKSASIFLNINLSVSADIPSPTRKKGSTSTSEDCVVPDIDDEDNVFNFEQPRVPAGKCCSK